MQDKVLDVFDKWQEKLSNTMSTIEHYGSVIEHFRNIMDVVGKDALGLDDQFMARFEQSAIDQSMDNIDATKAHYESLVSQNEEAQRRLAEARARGDKASEEHW
jgi:chromosome segregation ATPase